VRHILGQKVRVNIAQFRSGRPHNVLLAPNQHIFTPWAIKIVAIYFTLSSPIIDRFSKDNLQ